MSDIVMTVTVGATISGTVLIVVWGIIGSMIVAEYIKKKYDL